MGIKCDPSPSYHNYSSKVVTEPLFQNEESALAELQQKSKPYPYLSDALRTLPSELGLMLEVKVDLPYEVRHLPYLSCTHIIRSRGYWGKINKDN